MQPLQTNVFLLNPFPIPSIKIKSFPIQIPHFQLFPIQPYSFQSFSKTFLSPQSITSQKCEEDSSCNFLSTVLHQFVSVFVEAWEQMRGSNFADSFLNFQQAVLASHPTRKLSLKPWKCRCLCVVTECVFAGFC